MKAEKIFKTLIDGIFILQILGFLTLIIVIPSMSLVKINMQNTPVQEWSFLHWLLLLISAFSYTLFVIGIFYLKRLSKDFLKEKYFSKTIIQNSIKTGKMFITSGCLMILIFITQFVSNFTDGKIQLVYNTEFIFSLFIIAIGLFFLIQGKILNSGLHLKKERELTI